MGRHGRQTSEAVTVGRGHRGPRRRNTGARTGLLGASAAMAVGAAAVATGVLPSPTTFTDGHLFGGTDGGGPGNTARADGTPTALATDGATITLSGGPSAGASSPSAASLGVSPTRTTARPSTPVVHRTTATPAAKPRPAATASVAVTASTARTPAAQVLALVNQQRAQAGCQPLTTDPKLTELAQDFSAEMAARGFFDHTDPDGKTPWDRAAAFGITNLGGENIAEGQPDAQSVMDAWMNSPGHRANILDCDYRTIGIGVHYATGSESGGPWWTQDFGR
jgi:uncharacterized protein YkwD